MSASSPNEDQQDLVRCFAVTVPAESCYLRLVRAFFAPVLQDAVGKDGARLVLALDEACSNVVKYRAGSLDGDVIHVRAEVSRRRALFRIGDFCHFSDVPRIRPRKLEEVRPGGLGTHLIGQIMDEVRFEPEPGPHGRMALVLEKRIPQEGALDAAETPEH